MQVKQKESYDKLSRKIALTVITVSMAPLILVGGLIFDEFRSIYHAKVHAHLAEVVDKHKAYVDTFLEDKLHEVQYLSTAYTYEQMTDSTQLEDILKGMQQQYGRIIVDIGIVDHRGRQVSYAGPYDLLGADYSQAEWYVKSQKKKSGISDVFLGLRNTPHFIITVNDSDNLRKWTLRATIDFLAFSSMVENIRIGETGYAYIINRQGELQTTQIANSYQRITPSRGDRRTSTVEGVSVFESDGPDGDEYLTLSAPLNAGEWELVYQQNRSDAFSAMTRSEIFTLIIFLLGGLGIVLMALFISRKIVKKFQSIDMESQLMNRQMVETGKLASIGELASGVAHEINNPVAIMIEEAGWVEDLMEDQPADVPNREEIERALGQIRNQGKRCKDITHKLLSFARQTDDSHVTEVELPMLIEEVVSLSIQQARYAQVNFDMDIDHSLPAISGSTTELQQVFLNLINNSIQAMEHDDGGEVSISCQQDGEWIRTAIADTGPGIPAANLKRIFDPFFTTKPVGKGTGLGLSICFGIIHQMDGEIEVESTVGVGTTFIIRLPLPEQEQ